VLTVAKLKTNVDGVMWSFVDPHPKMKKNTVRNLLYSTQYVHHIVKHEMYFRTILTYYKVNNVDFGNVKYDVLVVDLLYCTTVFLEHNGCVKILCQDTVSRYCVKILRQKTVQGERV